MGNSSSGKSTLAKKLVEKEGGAHLDLDTLAWAATDPPERLPLDQSQSKITAFIDSNPSWVIEGCYADLLSFAAEGADQLIFLDLAVEDCLTNAKNRPWEPHKYPSKEAQNANLNMLLAWIADYKKRSDVCSYEAHVKLYHEFKGARIRHQENLDHNSVS